MQLHHTLIAVLAFATSTLSVKVDVYDGPKECEDSEKVKNGQQLTMEYTGSIDQSSETGEKGKQFDTSRGREPFAFQIGQGKVIPGWDNGLLGLCKGAKATLLIPPEEGYGASGAGDAIPGGATLLFDVEVIDMSDDVPAAPEQPNIFNIIDKNGDRKLDEEELMAFFKEQGRDSIPDGLFEKEDLDKDGVISWEEFSGPKGTSDEL